jgi:hypothetical protein
MTDERDPLKVPAPPTTGARIELVSVTVAETLGAGPVFEHYGRLFGENGEEVWRTSEVYSDPRAVLRAVELLSEVLAAVTDEDGHIAITPVRGLDRP